ncbi:MAG: hypothetical protein Ct9H300mP28_31600 [Pseudomonadota bacterium]|nr:MAG: hypothetical protein Ct9H300mP28_31600 [Pseudomonadota bacterium]
MLKNLSQKPSVKLNSTRVKFPFIQTPQQKHIPLPAKAIQKQLETHILNSVRFLRRLRIFPGDGGRIFIEFGPKNV